MAYKGYLLSIGNWKVPARYILPDSYKVQRDKEVLADWTDYNNRRHVIYSEDPHTTLSFQTPENFKLCDEDIAVFTEALQNARAEVTIDGTNKTVHDDMYTLTFYDPKTDTYRVDDFTLSNLQFTINRVTTSNVYYDPITFSFEEVDPDDF